MKSDVVLQQFKLETREVKTVSDCSKKNFNMGMHLDVQTYFVQIWYSTILLNSCDILGDLDLDSRLQVCGKAKPVSVSHKKREMYVGLLLDIYRLIVLFKLCVEIVLNCINDTDMNGLDF